MCFFNNGFWLIKPTISFDQLKNRSLTNSGPDWGVIISPIITDNTPCAALLKPILIYRSTEQYCGSAQTSWEQTELPQESVKKKKKHQYFIKLLSVSGPDQSFDSHSPTGRDGSFVFAPQVEQQSGSVHVWKCSARLSPRLLSCFWKVKGRVEAERVETCSRNVQRLNFLASWCHIISCFFSPTINANCVNV